MYYVFCDDTLFNRFESKYAALDYLRILRPSLKGEGKSVIFRIYHEEELIYSEVV